jgi:hypothetical protein
VKGRIECFLNWGTALGQHFRLELKIIFKKQQDGLTADIHLLLSSFVRYVLEVNRYKKETQCHASMEV